MLILSEMAGAAKELPEAIIVNPNNRVEIAAALKDALETSAEEQQRRNRLMQRRLRRYNVIRWADDFLSYAAGHEGIAESHRVEAPIVVGETRNLGTLPSKPAPTAVYRLRRHAHAAGRAIRRWPSPMGTLIALLHRLTSDRKNSVVITSGRDRRTLEEWFGDIPLGLVAEHGAWLRLPGQSWQRAKIAAERVEAGVACSPGNLRGSFAGESCRGEGRIGGLALSHGRSGTS